MSIQTKLVGQTGILTTLVGSYPVPTWLHALPSEQALIDATAVVLSTQLNAGIDLLADGELYRFDQDHPDSNGMIEYFVRPLSGVRSTISRTDLAEFREDAGMKIPRAAERGGHRPPRRGRPRPPPGLRSRSRIDEGPAKFTLTGPHMLAKTLLDHHYPDRPALCAALAEVLATQVSHLEAEVVQVDKANLPGHPEEWEWALESMNSVLDAVRSTPAVHLCFGNYGGQTIQAGTWDRLERYLSGLHADHVLLEISRRDNDEVARLARTDPRIRIGVGVIDIKTTLVESPEVVARRIERAVEFLGAARVAYVAPDCGFWMLNRSIADRKIQALVAGRDLFEGR